MKKRSRSSGNGRSISGPWLIGLLTLLLLFLRNRTSSQPTNQRQLIKNILKDNGYSDNAQKFWAAVSDHETGTWTSRLYRDYHNLWGMKQPKSRQTTSLGPTPSKEGDFASYSSDASSVQDLLLYMDEFNYPRDFSNVEALVSLMKQKGYYEAPEQVYLASVKKRIK